MTTWVFSCLMLLQGQGPAPGEVVYMNQRNLRIPVNLPEARRSELRELLMFASTDQARTWQQVAVIPPSSDAFNFNAPADGSYWLIVASVDRQGKQDPENLQKHGADMKLVIDTSRPILRLQPPQRQGDEVLVTWELKEEAPDWNSFRLDYQVKGSPTLSWNKIPATPGLTGQARFRPAVPDTVEVKLVIKDQAGNESLTTVEAPGTVRQTSFTPTPGPGSGSAPPPMPPPTNSGPIGTPLPPPSTFQPTTNPINQQMPPPIEKPLAEPSSLPRSVEIPQGDPGMKPVATTESATQVHTTSPGGPPQAAAPVRRTLPAVQYVNHPEVTLDYELNKVGPSGIGAIELWWTQNDGQSWELYATDPEVRGAGNGRHQRTLQLPGDGVYGFRLVVKSKAGLGKAPPRSGDVPELRVEVDSQAPVGELFPPSPDPQRPGALLLQWSAKDRNMAANPVTLEWAEGRSGPWRPIAANLSNIGRYSWQLPEQMPVQVYLRIRLQDLAGNEGIAITGEPQLVDLSEPEGRLVTVAPAVRRP